MMEAHKDGCYCAAVKIEVHRERIGHGVLSLRKLLAYSAAPVSVFTSWKSGQVEINKSKEFFSN